jgi:hypothetical protein
MNRIKLTRWFIFTVLAALVPVAFGSLILYYRNKPLSLEAVTSKGELLLISAGIAGAGIGELIASGTVKRGTAKLVCAGLCFITLMLSGMWFGDISSTTVETMNLTRLAYGSLIIFGTTLFASGGCVALAEI